MCLAQGPQRSDAGEARTRGPSVSSQALYHWATALPNPMFHIFYSTYGDASMYQDSSCRGFTLLLQLLKVRTAYLLLAQICPNYYSYSDDFWLKWDVCETGRQFPIIFVVDEGIGEICFHAGLPIHSFSILEKFAYISFLGKVRIKTHRFLWYFGHSCWES